VRLANVPTPPVVDQGHDARRKVATLQIMPLGLIVRVGRGLMVAVLGSTRVCHVNGAKCVETIESVWCVEGGMVPNVI